ncbi:MAG: DUF456 domain-containing protein [Flavobacteriaceae bacterium]|nr:DUF456 domain-containing protein [Flavobacteriaceae bacterium]
MDIFLLILGLVCMIVGVIGSFLPILPGPPISWLGLLLIHLAKAVPMDKTLLGITLAIALLVFVMDYIIPAMGTKKFGGSKYGVWGTTIGLLLAFIFPIFGLFGIIIWPFIGAFVGETLNKSNKKDATKAAFGSLIGFLTGTFLKFIVTLAYFGIFMSTFIDYWKDFFPYFQ